MQTESKRYSLSPEKRRKGCMGGGWWKFPGHFLSGASVTVIFPGRAGEKGVTHVAFVVHHLDLPRVAEFHHGPDGHIKLLA